MNEEDTDVDKAPAVLASICVLIAGYLMLSRQTEDTQLDGLRTALSEMRAELTEHKAQSALVQRRPDGAQARQEHDSERPEAHFSGEPLVVQERPSTVRQSVMVSGLAELGIIDATGELTPSRRPPADPVTVQRQLSETFTNSVLSQHAAISNVSCIHTRCDYEISFASAHVAWEQDMNLQAWVASADGRCGYLIGPLPTEDASVPTVRAAAIVCE